MPARCPKHLRTEVAKLSWQMDRWQIARKFDKSPGTIGNWFTDLRKEGYSVGIAPSPSPRLDTFLRLEGDAVIVGDIEFPDYHADTLVKAMEVGQKLGIKQLVLNGDVFAADQMSTWPQERPDPTTLKADMLLGDSLMEEFLTVFDTVAINLGNHDSRIAWKTRGQVTLADFFGHRAPKVQVSDYWYCHLHSNGRPWLVAHPKNVGQLPLAVSRRLAEKYQMNVVCAHVHHLAKGYDRSGAYQCLDGGCARDELRTFWKEAHVSTAPRWNVGFAVVVAGQGYIFHGEEELPGWFK